MTWTYFMTLTFKDFERDMSEFMATEDKLDKLSDAYSALAGDCKSASLDAHRELAWRLILEKYEDTFECISYWYYDLDRGKKWKKESVTHKNGKTIPFKTLKDVWNELERCKKV